MSYATSETVSVLEHDGKTIYLVGTAHVSEASVNEVREVIQAVQPDTVCIELCPTRYQALTDPSRWQRLNIFEVLRSGKALLLLANLAMSAYQRRLGAKLGIDPGAELLAGAREAEAVGAEVELVDRDIQTTLKRTWANVGFWKRAELLSAVVGATFSSENVEAEDIEKLKQGSQLSEMLSEFARYLPEVKVPLIDERDQYMMTKIAAAGTERIVAVVGAAHVPGMKRALGAPADIDALDEQPERSRWTSLLKWLIPALILAAFTLGYSKHEGESLEQMLAAWVVPNALFAGLLTAIAGAKLLSIITAFVCSPITSLNPALGAGMVVGLLEAYLRKPTVEDAQRISKDIETFSGFFRNPFTRVLLVAFMATIGSALGAWVGAAWVVWLGFEVG